MFPEMAGGFSTTEPLEKSSPVGVPQLPSGALLFIFFIFYFIFFFFELCFLTIPTLLLTLIFSFTSFVPEVLVV